MAELPDIGVELINEAVNSPKAAMRASARAEGLLDKSSPLYREITPQFVDDILDKIDREASPLSEQPLEFVWDTGDKIAFYPLRAGNAAVPKTADFLLQSIFIDKSQPLEDQPLLSALAAIYIEAAFMEFINAINPTIGYQTSLENNLKGGFRKSFKDNAALDANDENMTIVYDFLIDEVIEDMIRNRPELAQLQGSEHMESFVKPALGYIIGDNLAKYMNNNGVDVSDPKAIEEAVNNFLETKLKYTGPNLTQYKGRLAKSAGFTQEGGPVGALEQEQRKVNQQRAREAAEQDRQQQGMFHEMDEAQRKREAELRRQEREAANTPYTRFGRDNDNLRQASGRGPRRTWRGFFSEMLFGKPRDMSSPSPGRQI